MAKRGTTAVTLPTSVDIGGIPEPKAADRKQGADQIAFDNLVAAMKPGEYKAYDATPDMTAKGIVGRLSRAATRLVKNGHPEFKTIECFLREVDGREVAIIRFPKPETGETAVAGKK